MTTRQGTDFGRTQRPDHGFLARALDEPPLRPGVPIVDAHTHLWMHKSGYRYFVEEYAADVEASGHDIESAVFVECGAMYRRSGPEWLRSLGETEFAVGMAAIAESGCFTDTRAAAAIVGNVDLTRGAAAGEVLDAHLELANGRFRGVRHRAKWDPDPAVKGAVSADRPGLYLEPALQRGLVEVAARGLVFQASIFHPQISDVVELARAVPEAQIVVIHTASPVTRSSYADRLAEVHRDFVAGLQRLAACPNVTIKLGGLLMSLGTFDFQLADRPPTSFELVDLWRPYLEPCLELFGPERCMVSSNFPVDKAGIPYRTIWNMFSRLTEGFSPEERRQVFAGTAQRVYRIDDPVRVGSQVTTP
ncbi:amidohydrolase family protein [Saccharomonospora sp. NPDC046836]|uniref:amidohydrolase family protein n=1 Tax=Saccharomonospora sp. NPDC046836 TaxID=3156921 RepID=UPI00340FA69A